MDFPVGVQGVAPVEPCTKQDSFPEVAHDRKMGFQAPFPDFGERLGEEVIVEGWAVEAS